MEKGRVAPGAGRVGPIPESARQIRSEQATSWETRRPHAVAGDTAAARMSTPAPTAARSIAGHEDATRAPDRHTCRRLRAPERRNGGEGFVAIMLSCTPP